ncbi:MAG TPA: glycoside hydrolase family 20 zincin-like fold domain-containing protein, partial [Chloroflexia bacterium]|nr:glycoside hydrolase family 20 zincin-like fold domain-containing protein [Chloroflexia bacterium]
MNDNLYLLPHPRSLSLSAGRYALTPNGRILLEGAAPSELLGAGRRLQAALAKHADLTWELSAGGLGPVDEVGIVLRLAPGGVAHREGYELTITPEGTVIQAQSPVGVFYGVCTLVQILQQRGRNLPALHVTDWPDFAARGLMLDISRDKVPRMETLFELIDMLASWKLNQLQLYTEHTFAYRRHPDVWVKASPITGDEVLALDLFCRERHIELVPNQNSFGHMQRWLAHDRYAALAEVHGEFQVPWGTMQGPFSLCPGDPGSLELVRGLYDELLPHFSSKQFNVGCDETFDLGQGRSREECERRGVERVYLDYLIKIHREVEERGYTMQFWGDIIVHTPELISELPKNSIALEWGYEADHPFDEHGAMFANSGIPFYVCPGTSSWTSIAGRTDNAVGNLLSAAENGLKHGAAGYLNTDWGDHGHWQTLPISYLGFAVGAAYSWALEANRDMDVAAVVSTHAFHDPTGSMGRVAYDLGNVYKAPEVSVHNGSALFWTLQRPFEQLRKSERPRPDFASVLEAIDAAMTPLSKARIHRPDAALIVRECENTASLLRHACLRGRLAAQPGDAEDATSKALDEDMRDIIREYEHIWLERNRPGGLADSIVALEKARADYKT